MHHSNEPNLQTMAFGCYLDESGTDDLSVKTVVGGLLLNRNNFILFDDDWKQLMKEMNIKHPIHMKDFGQHGKLGYLSYSDRYYLFASIAGIINKYKIYSIAGVINQQQYNNILKLKKKEFSPYGFCFLLCVYINHKEAINNNRWHNIAYLMAAVSEHSGQIKEVHEAIKKGQENNILELNVGSLAFDSPKKVTALQAADVIAWGVRKQLLQEPFNRGFECIEHIINGNHHSQYSWEESMLQELGSTLAKLKSE